MTIAELRAACPSNDTGAYMAWLEERVLELTADEEPRQAAERIVQSHLDNAELTDDDLRNQITTAIQAASNAQLERGRKAAEAWREIERDKHSHVAHVRDFMEKFDQHIGDTPGFPPQEVLDLRVKLMAEEFCEMLEAGGYNVGLTVDRGMGARTVQVATQIRYAVEGSFSRFVQELVDLEVTTLGTHVACGVDPQPIWEAVHAANMAKQPAADKFSKITKPDGWTPPDIAGALKEQGWQGGAE